MIGKIEIKDTYGCGKIYDYIGRCGIMDGEDCLEIIKKLLDNYEQDPVEPQPICMDLEAWEWFRYILKKEKLGIAKTYIDEKKKKKQYNLSVIELNDVGKMIVEEIHYRNRDYMELMLYELPDAETLMAFDKILGGK